MLCFKKTMLAELCRLHKFGKLEPWLTRDEALQEIADTAMFVEHGIDDFCQRTITGEPGFKFVQLGQFAQFLGMQLCEHRVLDKGIMDGQRKGGCTKRRHPRMTT